MNNYINTMQEYDVLYECYLDLAYTTQRSQWRAIKDADRIELGIRIRISDWSRKG